MWRWQADDELSALLQCYYSGEAGLWDTIHRMVDEELRQRKLPTSAYHIRFRETSSGFDVIIEDARDYVRAE
ncbi:MAG: hypothetical protein MUD01_09250 [Chloroflexaceae bacterium]|jgi:hypothetical protein|nr:hypothetical protein [Chloroflexaceae bacterium]